jgi:histone H3/H4
LVTGRQNHLNQSLLRIPRRAEGSDRHTASRTYVEAGSFAALLHSSDHQILYGRRGTGKTHALLYLADLLTNAGHVALYIDLRTIGSAGCLHADSAVPATERGTQLLIDTLEEVHDGLLTIAMERDITDPTGLLRELDALAEAATTVRVVGEVERETTVGGSAESTHGAEVSLRPDLRLSASTRQSVSTRSRLRRTGVERHQVMFGPLSRAVRSIVKVLAPARLWLLLDEWSSVPRDLQPFLADLLRRAMLPVGGLTVKIAAIERRSRFAAPTESGGYVGIEVGSDAASSVDLDEFLTFGNSRPRAVEFFARLFHNHTSVWLRTMVKDPPADIARFVEECFHRNAFTELVRAAEGVPRDAINIAALAAQHAHDKPIDVADVRRAARDWYLRDKQTAINGNPTARTALRVLVDEVVGQRRARTFVVDQLAVDRAGIIEDLHDARLLHLLRRGIADPHHPGALYDGFAIDYGCYVSLLLDDAKFQARGRGDWLDVPTGVPPEGFKFARSAIDVGALLDPSHFNV